MFFLFNAFCRLPSFEISLKKDDVIRTPLLLCCVLLRLIPHATTLLFLTSSCRRRRRRSGAVSARVAGKKEGGRTVEVGEPNRSSRTFRDIGEAEVGNLYTRPFVLFIFFCLDTYRPVVVSSAQTRHARHRFVRRRIHLRLSRSHPFLFFAMR